MAEKPAKAEPKTVRVKEPLSQMGGSKSDHWNHTLADQAVQTLWVKNSSVETRDRQIEATIAALIGINPRDEIEGMLAAQMLASHNAAMECYRRAMLSDQTFEGRNMALTHAAKASRTYAALVEALNRHRGKGQQKVTVEHVHVHKGGQAIVGAVGGGFAPKSEDQPHAKQIARESIAPMLGALEAERETLPSASRSRV
jgi:hypothetical protein